jgi:hypothetical protein
MVKKRELGLIYHNFVKSMENGILMNSMDAEKLNFLIEAFIVATTRMVIMKDM